MKITLRGAAYEVGRSCVEVESDKNRFLFDAGLKIGEETQYPTKIPKLNKLDAVFLSHAHLDHSGALPYLNYNGLHCPIFTTTITRLMTKLLLKDSFHIETLSHIPPYQKQNIYNVLGSMEDKKQNQFYEFKDMRFKLFDAGHIAGASSILVDTQDKRILYSGDINTVETKIATKTKIEAEDVDALILETTYGDREHPSRKETEKKFLDEIQETIQMGGSVVLPAFAIGRSQELMMLLNKKFGVPIYLDGMAKKIADLFLQRGCTNNKEDFKSAYNRIRQVHGWKERKNLLKDQGIFITTAGMMDGGPVMDYLKFTAQDPKNSILLTGWQAEGTNGRRMMEKGSVYIDGMSIKVKANYKQYDMSAHAGLSELKELVQKINPRKVILNHGDPSSIENLSKDLRKLGFETFTPKLNDTINI
ncbi:MBL fold metallo-hydrolase [Nanoarchaeota archaeon]